MHFVFVYGTLKRGQPNHYLLQNESNGLREFCGNGKTKTKFPMVVASRYNIPYVLDLPNAGNNIYGEIWRVDDNMLKTLDKLENHPLFYERSKEAVDVVDANVKDLKSGDIVECWIYRLTNFKDHLMALPFIDNYDCNNDPKFVFWHLRPPNCPSHIVDVKNGV